MKYSKKMMRPIRLSVAGVIFIAPFLIGFYKSPIYQGDFSLGGEDASKIKHPNLTYSGLTIITIPGCPFCLGSIPMLQKIKERYPQVPIQYVICSLDTAYANNLNKENGELLDVKLAENPDDLMNIAKGSFPTFVMVEKGKPTRIWSNDDFGPRAIDKIESTFAKEPYKKLEEKAKLEDKKKKLNEQETEVDSLLKKM